jgi:hypothetical protein
VMRSRRTGARTRIEEGDMWTRKDKVSRDAGALPGYRPWYEKERIVKV